MRSPRSTAFGRWLGVALVLLTPTPAVAHETPSTIVPVVDGFDVAVEGVEVRLSTSQDASLITLEVTGDHEVELVTDGVAWARITAAEVSVDPANPSLLASLNARGAVPGSLPAAVDPWPVVSRDGSFTWFEHRMHPAELGVDPAVLASDEDVELARWRVPMRVDGVDVVLEGRLLHVPLRGQVVPRLLDDRELAEGVTLDVLPGGVPGFLLSSTPDRTVVVLGPDGRPYVRLDGQGAVVDRASVLWQEQQRHRGAPLGEQASGLELVSGTPSHSWLDARAAVPGIRPDQDVRTSGEEVVLVTWEIPLEVDGELVVASGETVWVPIGTGGTDEGGVPPEDVVALVAVLLLVGLGLRHRRGRRPTPAVTDVAEAGSRDPR